MLSIEAKQTEILRLLRGGLGGAGGDGGVGGEGGISVLDLGFCVFVSSCMVGFFFYSLLWMIVSSLEVGCGYLEFLCCVPSLVDGLNL